MDPPIVIVVVGTVVAGFVQGLVGFRVRARGDGDLGLVARSGIGWSSGRIWIVDRSIPREWCYVAGAEPVACISVCSWRARWCSSRRSAAALHQSGRVQGQRRAAVGRMVSVDAVRSRTAADQLGRSLGGCRCRMDRRHHGWSGRIDRSRADSLVYVTRVGPPYAAWCLSGL